MPSAGGEPVTAKLVACAVPVVFRLNVPISERLVVAGCVQPVLTVAVKSSAWTHLFDAQVMPG